MKRRSYGRWINKEDEVFDEEIEETEKIQKKAMKQEIVEGEREGSNTTITATIMAISPNDQFYEFSNISEENPVSSKTTHKNNILMAAQLGMKGPPPSGEQPVDKMFNSQLIKEISQHPALFDFTCDEYKSIEARNRNWDEVSSHSCQPLEFVRTRWKTLRDRFKKEVRRIKQQQLQQPENAFNGCWHHFEEMLFLLPFVRDKAEEVVSHSKEGEGEATSSPADVTTSAQALIQAYTLAKQRQLNNSSINILNSENQQQSQQQQQQQMQSSTAAILDLAMNAVHKSNKEIGENNERGECLNEEENDDNNEEINNGGGGGGGGGYSNGNSNLNISTNSKSSSIYRQPSIRFQKQFQNNQQKLLQLNEINNRINNNWKFPEVFGENEDDEDKLFCRIVLKKLGKLDERLKDTAKIKIMELLLNLQYGECNNTTSNSSGR
uniref:MADF domain-containing protein n=2 Tax=Meloidogyne TaxID=189290 RepID=A0A914KYR7_MELIC